MKVIFTSKNGKAQVIYNPWKESEGYYEVYLEDCFRCRNHSKDGAIANAKAYAENAEGFYF